MAGRLVSIVVEGCVDRFCGRPRHQNPYCPDSAADAFESWEWGWDDAHALLELRGQEEAQRWLGEAAA